MTLELMSESSFTAPRPDCPRPELWHAVDAYSTEVEVSELVATFVRALQPELVVETGTCVGLTALMIGQALAANGHGRLVSLEVNDELAAGARQTCAGLPVEILTMSSMDYVPGEPIGFAWFDSLLSLRVAEFERFRPWLTAGTIVGFHDTGPQFGQYGDDVAQIPGTRSIRLRTPRGVTFAEVL